MTDETIQLKYSEMQITPATPNWSIMVNDEKEVWTLDIKEDITAFELANLTILFQCINSVSGTYQFSFMYTGEAIMNYLREKKLERHFNIVPVK